MSGLMHWTSIPVLCHPEKNKHEGWVETMISSILWVHRINYLSFLDFRCKQHPCWISRNAKEYNKNTQKYLSACKKQTIFTDSQGMYLALWPTQALLCWCLHIPCLQPLKPNEKQREHSVQDFLQNENSSWTIEMSKFGRIWNTGSHMMQRTCPIPAYCG
jgi:hypothetical protein